MINIIDDIFFGNVKKRLYLACYFCDKEYIEELNKLVYSKCKCIENKKVIFHNNHCSNCGRII